MFLIFWAIILCWRCIAPNIGFAHCSTQIRSTGWTWATIAFDVTSIVFTFLMQIVFVSVLYFLSKFATWPKNTCKVCPPLSVVSSVFVCYFLARLVWQREILFLGNKYNCAWCGQSPKNRNKIKACSDFMHQLPHFIADSSTRLCDGTCWKRAKHHADEQTKVKPITTTNKNSKNSKNSTKQKQMISTINSKNKIINNTMTTQHTVNEQ